MLSVQLNLLMNKSESVRELTYGTEESSLKFFVDRIGMNFDSSSMCFSYYYSCSSSIYFEIIIMSPLHFSSVQALYQFGRSVLSYHTDELILIFDYWIILSSNVWGNWTVSIKCELFFHLFAVLLYQLVFLTSIFCEEMGIQIW